MPVQLPCRREYRLAGQCLVAMSERIPRLNYHALLIQKRFQFLLLKIRMHFRLQDGRLYFTDIGVPREEIFLETKIWPAFYEQEDAVEKTLQRLDTDYIDLLLTTCAISSSVSAKSNRSKLSRI